MVAAVAGIYSTAAAAMVAVAVIITPKLRIN